MRIVVIGGGSVGLIYASYLSTAQNTTLLVRRDAQADAINTSGITVDRPDGTNIFNLEATSNTKTLIDADLIISLTKCYDAVTVADICKENMSTDSVLIGFHNGIGTLDIYNKQLGKENVIGGMTYIGADRISDNHAQAGLTVKTNICEQNNETTERIKSFHDIFVKAGFETYIAPEIKAMIWDKMVMNVAQNAISALADMSFQQMKESDQATHLANQLLDEMKQVCFAQGIDYSSENLVERVVANWSYGKDHHSSMWQDIHAKRKTEIDFINGAVSQLGKQYGIQTPVNDTIVSLIKMAEHAEAGGLTLQNPPKYDLVDLSLLEGQTPSGNSNRKFF